MGPTAWLDALARCRQQAIDSVEKAKDQGARNATTPLLTYADHQHMTPHEVRELTTKAHYAYMAGGDQSDTDDTRGW